MLDIKFIREHAELVEDAAVKKGVSIDVEEILGLDGQVKTLRTHVETLRRQRNQLAASYAEASQDEREALSRQSHELSVALASEEFRFKELSGQLQTLLLLTPNIPATSSPIGTDDSENVVERREGHPPAFDFTPADHTELLRLNGWAELGDVAHISGSRTFTLKGNLVKYELALINFALDVLCAEGFTPITVPPFARESAFVGTGHFPAGKEDAYALPNDDLYLVGTSEVILNSLHANQILREADLPILYAGVSQCFRREAGSSGRDVRGLLRVHHFTKVEQFVICRNDEQESTYWHNRLLGIAEKILHALELPYQVINCCTGDMGLGKVKMNDIETWVPSLDTYRETHSCSTLHDWQARRTQTRYRADDSKDIKLVHTLNNTALATPRIFAALLENHQTASGQVKIPKALQPYMGGQSFL
ncbi:serine--tRNA ligase [Pseudomonas sp. LRF_L74]|uniref:serine--tRNA ligase n=1 Tax=Pseudomonas sp. LRF_L74 TaxID=3369422 RepID=UPI003F63A5ED